MASTRRSLCVVVPVYNEESVLPAFIARIAAVMDGLADRYALQVIFVDDGSSDQSWRLIQGAGRSDTRFRGIRLSRNFGHQAAISCGYELAHGDAVVSIDADLQDPPEVIPELIRQWEGGSRVVLAVRRSREGEAPLKRWTARVYYRLLSTLSESEAPESAGDFRLLDRTAVDALNRFSESHRYVRGLVGWLGFERSVVEYARAPRFAGETKYPLSRMLRLAMDGIFSLSSVPLRVAYLAAFLLTIPFLLYLAYNLILYLFFDVSMVPGWPSLILATILFGSFILLMLGILGEYVGRVYAEVKRRPLYLISEVSGEGVMASGEPTGNDERIT